MQLKSLAAVVALMASLGAAAPNDATVARTAAALDDAAFKELYTCCGLGRRGELDTRCCQKRDEELLKRDPVALTDGEFHELYCCGLGRRGELNTRCCA